MVEGVKTRVTFVRHGEAEGNVGRFFHGHYDSNLTDNGRTQAQLVAKRLEGEHFDVLYSSDLRRTMDTAAPIANSHGLDIHPIPALREIHGGKWENERWEDLPTLFPTSYQHWLNEPDLLVMPDGESMIQFQKRLKTAVEAIVTANQGKHICIVTHGTAIKVLLCTYWDKGLAELPDLPWQDNTAITVVEFDAAHNPKVLIDGDNAHLGACSTLAKQDWWRKY